MVTLFRRDPDKEFSAIYNTPHDPDFHLDGAVHINTVGEPPALTLAEAVRVQRAAEELVVEYANSYHFSREERREYYSCCVNAGLSDRTVAISFVAMEDCNPTFLDCLQLMLQKDFALWRVSICGASPASSIMLYPTETVFGNIREKDRESALREIVDLNQRLIDPRQVFERQQRELLRPIIKKVIGRGFVPPIECLASFDNCRGNPALWAIWTLYGKEIISIDILIPELESTCAEIRVKQDGDFGRHVTDAAPFRIRQWNFPERPRGGVIQLRLSDENDVQIDRTIDITQCPFYRQIAQ